MNDILALREQLWGVIAETAQAVTSADVVSALKTITDDMNQAGIDRAYDRTTFQDADQVIEPWNLIWMSLLAVELKRRIKTA